MKPRREGNPPVVVGIDGSPSALAAARWSACEAARRGAPLQLISAFSWSDTRRIGAPGLGGHYRRRMLTSAHAAVSAAAETAAQAAPGIEISERVDDFLIPLLIAASRRAGLLVIGDRGLGGLSSPLRGSAGTGLAARAQCPVVVVRGGQSSEASVVPLLAGDAIETAGPVRVPDGAGLEIAARYRPASPGAGVGGDWYGILPLPDGRLLFTVGDIAGHGFAAATAMAQLFHALQGLALTGADSGQLLRWLNAVTCSLSTFTIASACVGLYDPADRRLCVANAGHPSPVLVRAGEAAAIPRPAGPMLGVDEGSSFDEETIVLEGGDVLLFYTDGLIERRRHSPDENIDRLLAEASSAEPDLDRYVDRILEHGESDTDDDTCILAVRFS